MLLKRLLNPRWGKAAKDADKAQSSATEAADPGARRQACKSLTDLEQLQRIAADDPDAGVREFAAARLRKLLAGTESDGPNTPAAIAYLQANGDPTLAAHLAREAGAAELRQAAVTLIDDPAILCTAAAQDPVAAVRLAAAQQLEDKAALERLAKQIGRKDKNVLREVRTKLKLIADREQEPELRRRRAEELCLRLERLGRRGSWSQDKALLEHGEREWQDIADGLPASLIQRYQQAREDFLRHYGEQLEQEQALQRQRERQQGLMADKQALIGELSGLAAEQISDAILNGLQERWTALPKLSGDDEKRLRQDWEQAWRQAGATLKEQRRLREREQRLEELSREGRDWGGHSGSLQHEAFENWLRRGKKLAALAPDDPAARDFEAVCQELQQRMDKQIDHAEQKLEQLPERLELLAQELEQGRLKPATALHQSIHADLDLCRASGLARKRYSQAEGQLHRLTPRLRELQNWRKWGTDQHRQDLLQAMQALETADLSAEALFEKVQELQQQWKALDHSGSPVNEGLWKRFHQAADSVFERCKPYLEQQAEQRENHRQAREALCKRLEDFLDQVDWDNVDWKKAARAEREIRSEWAGLGEVQPKLRKALDKRYHKAMKRLDQHLSGERTANKSLKQGLIEQARALVEEPDLERAIHEIKSLQKQWHTTVPSRRKQENQLWQHFREACDQVFARRDESRDAQRRELDDNAGRISALCDELESLGATRPDQPEDLLQPLHKLQGRWDEESRLTLARKDAERLKHRWHAGVKALRQQIATLRHDAERARMRSLAQAAELCRELEKAVAETPPDASPAAAWERRWTELQLSADAPDGLRRRFDAALRALTDAGEQGRWLAGQEANAGRRAEICLQLEILAGIESPPEAAQERLALQVSRLAGHLGEGEGDSLIALPSLELDWYQTGPAPHARAETLENRFQRALAAALPQPESSAAETP
jgi:exonuclease SbcC